MENNNQEIKKRQYEIGFVLKTENAAIVSDLLKNRGFSILTEGPLNKVQLAYPIKKETYAYFGFIHFEGDPAAIKNLKEDLKLNAEVLRYLIITPPIVKKPPSKKTPPTTKPAEETRFTLPSDKQDLAAESILTNEALEKKIKEYEPQ